MKCTVLVFDNETGKKITQFLAESFTSIRRDIRSLLHNEGRVTPNVPVGKFDVNLCIVNYSDPEQAICITAQEIQDMIDYQDPTNKFKVVLSSNYDLDEFDESVTDSFLNYAQAHRLATSMNDAPGRDDSIYYIVKPQTYVLRERTY